MDKTGKRSLLESVPVLVILGLLAGACGRLGNWPDSIAGLDVVFEQQHRWQVSGIPHLS